MVHYPHNFIAYIHGTNTNTVIYSWWITSHADEWNVGASAGVSSNTGVVSKLRFSCGYWQVLGRRGMEGAKKGRPSPPPSHPSSMGGYSLNKIFYIQFLSVFKRCLSGVWVAINLIDAAWASYNHYRTNCSPVWLAFAVSSPVDTHTHTQVCNSVYSFLPKVYEAVIFILSGNLYKLHRLKCVIYIYCIYNPSRIFYIHLDN